MRTLPITVAADADYPLPGSRTQCRNVMVT